MPTCSICAKFVKGKDQPGQDQSTFVCEDCQNLVNLDVWKKELAELKKKGEKANPSEIRRKEFLEKKIASIQKE